MTQRVKAVVSVCMHSAPEHFFLHSCVGTVHKLFTQTGTAEIKIFEDITGIAYISREITGQ